MDAKKSDEKGQALIEFVMFLPFIVMMYSVIVSLGSAINGAINQQKVARSYFYYKMQNNSMVPKAGTANRALAGGWQSFGMQIMGWAGQLQNEQPIYTCYRFRVPLGEDADEGECEDAYSSEKTQYIKLGVVYGVCGASYRNSNGQIIREPATSESAPFVVSAAACQIK